MRIAKSYDIAVSSPVLLRVRRCHAIASVIEYRAGKDRGRGFQFQCAFIGACGELGLDGFKLLSIDNGLVLPTVCLPAMRHLPDVEAVSKQVGERADGERNAAPCLAGFQRLPTRLQSRST